MTGQFSIATLDYQRMNVHNAYIYIYHISHMLHVWNMYQRLLPNCPDVGKFMHMMEHVIPDNFLCYHIRSCHFWKKTEPYTIILYMFWHTTWKHLKHLSVSPQRHLYNVPLTFWHGPPCWEDRTYWCHWVIFGSMEDSCQWVPMSPMSSSFRLVEDPLHSVTQHGSGPWFGTCFVLFHIFGIMVPIDIYFSEGLKTTTRSVDYPQIIHI